MDFFHLTTRQRLVILVLISLAYAALIAPSISKPAILDETVFVDAARSVALYGKPYISDMTGWDNAEYDGSATASFHPPLYVDILALFIRLFGDNISSVRIFSAIAVWLSSLLVYLIGRKISPDGKKDAAGLTSMLLFLINPLTLQNGTFIEINGTVLTFSLLLFAYFFIRWHMKTRPLHLFTLGLLMSLVMWSKFEGVALLSAAIFVYSLLKRGIKDAIIRTTLITGTGIAFFLASFYPVSLIQQIDFAGPFARTIGDSGSIVSGIGTAAILFHRIWAVKNFFFWMTPAFLLLISIIFLNRLSKYRTKSLVEPADFLLIFGIANLAASLLIAPDAYGFPKYIEAVPFFSIAISCFVIQMGCFTAYKKHAFLISALAAALLLFSALLVKDPFITHNIFWTQHMSFGSDFAKYVLANAAGLLFFVPAAISLIAFSFLRLQRMQSIAASLFFLAIFTSLYIGVIQSQADYSTSYAYGQRGLTEVVNYLKENSSPNDSMLGRIDICAHARLKCYLSYPQSEEVARQVFAEAIGDKTLRYAVLSPSENAGNFPGFYRDFSLEREIGHFEIYRRNPAS